MAGIPMNFSFRSVPSTDTKTRSFSSGWEAVTRTRCASSHPVTKAFTKASFPACW